MVSSYLNDLKQTKQELLYAHTLLVLLHLAYMYLSVNCEVVSTQKEKERQMHDILNKRMSLIEKTVGCFQHG
jgi:hypothetical protein